MKGRTVVLKEYFKPLEIQEYDVPDPEPGAVLVQIKLAGLCGSDLHTWRGDQVQRPLPETGRPMGHEGMGVIYSLGKGVTSDFRANPLREGDRVIFSAVYGCGRCEYCLDGSTNHCPEMRLNYRTAAEQPPYFVNTYSDFAYLPPAHPVFRVPDGLLDEEVASLNCAMGTVLQGLTQANARHGQVVVIQGAGGLGLYATAFASDLGAAHVIVVDGQPARMQLAMELGATETIDIQDFSEPAARVSRVMELTSGRGADLVLELVGSGDVVQEGLDMLRPGGTFVEIGNIIRGRTARIEPSTLLRSKRILGSSMYRPALLPTILDFLVRNQGRRPLAKVISHKFALADINAAFEQSEWARGKTEVIRGGIVP